MVKAAKLRTAKNGIRFNRYFVTDGTTRARIYYSLDNRVDRRLCVTLYEKGYDRNLGKIFGDLYRNDTDSQTDYFDEGRVNLFEDHPLYQVARNRAEAIRQSQT